MPTVAVRSGSPAVLSRMFHAGVQDGGDRDEAEGERDPRRESRSRRPGPGPGSSLSARRRAAHIPHAPEQQAADGERRRRRRCPAQSHDPDHRLAEVRGQRDLVEHVRAASSAGTSEVDAGTSGSRSAATISPANDGPEHARPTASPIPASASAYSPRTSVPATGVATSPPVIAEPIPIPIMTISREHADRGVHARGRRGSPSGPATSASRAASRAGPRSRPTPSRRRASTRRSPRGSART